MATSGASCSHGFIKLFGQAILIPSPSSPPNPQEPLVATITDDDQEGEKWRRRRRRRRRAMTLPSQLCMLQAYNASSSHLTTTTTNTSLPLLLRERKKGIPWTEDEHRMFLLGLEKLGKGDWRGISRTFVTSRTPTQVASHAQKYFLRQCSLDKRIKRRSSLFDMISTSSSSSSSSNGHKDNASLLTHANALLSIHCQPASSSSHSEDEPEHHIINVNSSSTLKIQPNVALPMVRRPTTLLI